MTKVKVPTAYYNAWAVDFIMDFIQLTSFRPLSTCYSLKSILVLPKDLGGHWSKSISNDKPFKVTSSWELCMRTECPLGAEAGLGLRAGRGQRVPMCPLQGSDSSPGQTVLPQDPCLASRAQADGRPPGSLQALGQLTACRMRPPQEPPSRC